MKKDIHPKYKELEIKIGNDKFYTNSTYAGDKILMDVDFREHPAWNKALRGVVSQSSKSVSGFNKKFSGISFLSEK
ncbi:50S ribosomal protein L31 [Rickettsia endosymbiont of Cardiosporidium cionae]|uniref:50S ribosomal protein L31 n=1 Tax=Rickettsia endosymbiont of Cardiosporidium cionae TaxID=2777155 RepID=UPI001893F91D|nr:50S ribosomal protein L31 [Rickettsia endosymbiont of Cardiosporidium cionae]KAF8818281.1 50S ribosomal protein L31 [Rickettsia endosymbiont of Cardiosporidium cionae]